MRISKRALLAALLALSLLLFCACRQNPPQQQLYAKLTSHFEQRGYTCELTALLDSQPSMEVPIYNASVWNTLTLNGSEPLYVYFDESNRADYLCSLIDQATYSRVVPFGLRFVLYYPGTDEGVLRALDEI